MRCRFGAMMTLLALVSAWSGATATAEEYKVAELKEAPAGLSAEVLKTMQASGYRITGPAGTVCDVWLVKEVKLRPGFKPTLRVKYPFLMGSLVGAIRFPEKGEYHDFRGQAIKPGTYTLRNGLQPDDGNHLGTSEIRDFIVACPPDKDKDPKRIDKPKSLFKLSQEAAGTTHPAIYLLQPPGEKPFAAAEVKHDAANHRVVLSVNVTGKDGDKEVIVPLNLVTIGKFEG